MRERSLLNAMVVIRILLRNQYIFFYSFSFDRGLTSDLSAMFNQRQLGTQFWKSNEGHDCSVKS